MYSLEKFLSFKISRLLRISLLSDIFSDIFSSVFLSAAWITLPGPFNYTFAALPVGFTFAALPIGFTFAALPWTS